MTTRSQKKKAVEQRVTGEFDVPEIENRIAENPVAGLNKFP